MAESNHAALGEALNLYRSAMRRLIAERLRAVYKQNWWEDGVLRKLPETMRENLRREIERSPGRERLELIDVGQIEKLVIKNFDLVFESVFHDFRATQSRLGIVTTARNQWAHPGRSGDLPSDEVGVDLFTIGQLLSSAALPEAAEVERIRAGVLRIQSEAPAEAERAVRAATAGELPYWWQVCEPQDAFKNPAKIDESLFAATLGGVFAGSARAEYLEPAIFFSHTYFTENLKQTIRDVASRLQGGDGPSVTEMQTPFGGGKTHALLSLYHLIRDPKQSLSAPGVREALGDVAIPANARVLVFDGQEAGAEPAEKQNGFLVATLWGELAYQVSPDLFHRLISKSDTDGTAPGNALFRQVLEAASPCLILIDELVSYLVKLRFTTGRRTQNLYRQTVQFLQEMLQEAGNVPGVCVLISLPKSKREFGGLDPQQLQLELGIVDDLQARTDRVVSKRTPVNDDEIYTLMSKRLFKSVDRDVAGRVARRYREVYERERALYDQTVFSPEYLRDQVSAYPLHPELIDVLYKKWSTGSDFPRTRTVLQLLASVVADQWLNRREAYAIQSSDVNLERERIRTKIVSAAGSGGGYDAVVAADIIGGDAHADMQDQRRGAEYERFHIARGVATTLLMHSFGGATRAGALPSELRLGTVAPNVGPEYVSEVLDNLEQSLWYVHREGDLLRFETKPNVYRIIAERAEAQPSAAVAAKLAEVMTAANGGVEGFRLLDWDDCGKGMIEDRPDPSIAVLPPRYAFSADRGDEPPAAPEPVERLWERVGRGLREWRNALILVAPDADLWSRTEEAMREVMAYESVIASAERGALGLSQIDLKDVKGNFAGKRESLRTSVVTAYRWVFFPDDRGLSALSLPVPATKSETILGRLAGRLSDQDYGTPKILRKMSAIYFNTKLVPRLWKDEASPLDLQELLRRFPNWTFLPILPRREETLRACIEDGLATRLWAVVLGDNSTSTYRQLIERRDDLPAALSLFDGTVSLVKGEMLHLIRDELRPAEAVPEPMRDEATARAETQAAAQARASAPYATAGKADGRLLAEAQAEGIRAPRRLSQVHLQIDDLSVAKTSNLQAYLFRVLQEQDPTARLAISIDVSSGVGIAEEALTARIVEGFDQLGINVSWSAGE